MSLPKIPSTVFWLAVAILGMAGCHDSDQRTKPVVTPDATKSGSVPLDELQQKRMGIELAAVRSEKIRTTIPVVGWFTLPPANEAVIRAPVAGFAMVKPNQEWPTLGQKVSAGLAVAQLNVFLSPQEVSQLVQAKEENDIQMQQSLVTMELSETQLKLASTARDAVSGVRLSQLKEAFERAKIAHKEAQEKLPFLIQEPYENGVLVKPLSIEIPRAGRILQIHVTSGQFVQAGDPLWTVADWSTLWLRVPLFEEDSKRIDPSRAAEVHDRLSGTRTTGAAITVPTETKAVTRTVDFYYAVANPEWKLRVGQSTTVELPTVDAVQAMLIPRTAVLYDGFGQTYCYVSELDRTLFQRKRIELGIRHKSRVVVLRGLDADDLVVSVGAEQLSAEESKGNLAVEGD